MVVKGIGLVLLGILAGIGAAFTGPGGGANMVPALLMMGCAAQKAVGTSFLAILVISLSALVIHNELAHVDCRVGLLLGLGGVLGAQLGGRLVENVSAARFKGIFAVVPVGLDAHLFIKK